MPPPIETLQRMLRGEVPPPPVASLIGFRLTAVAAGEATVEFDAGPQHANPLGTLHGGILCDVADAAMGLAL
jgi:acyl-coenzyme A thioesterase PaaI-like protein